MEESYREIERLKERLQQEELPQQFETIVALSVLIWKTAPGELLTYAFKALEIAKTIQDHQKKGKALHLIGVGFYGENKFYKSLEYFRESIEIRDYINDHLGAGSSLNNIGLIYWKLGEYDQALIHYQRSLKQIEQVSDQDNPTFQEQYASTLTNIGNLYDTIGKHDLALKEFHKSLEIHEKIKNAGGISILLNNIGNVHRNRSELQEALTYYQKSLAIKEKLGHQGGIANTLHNIGQIYFMEGDNMKTLDHCKRSLDIFEKIEDQYGIAANLNYMGKILIREEAYEEAREKLKRGEEIAREINARNLLMENFYTVSDLFTLKERYQEALFYYKEHSELKEELFNEEKSEKFAQLQTRYEIEQKNQEAEIYRLKNVELKKANLRLKQMYVQLDLISKTDPLTKIFNRRAISEKLNDERVRFERNGRPFTVILGDLDNFKKFNDQYGHDCGDYVLISTASLIQKKVRKQDSVGRWGGEEFIILLPETDQEGGFFVSEKIRSQIQSNILPYKGIKLGVTITFGVASFRPNESIDDLIKRADNALYKGKEKGRNLSVSAE